MLASWMMSTPSVHDPLVLYFYIVLTLPQHDVKPFYVQSTSAVTSKGWHVCRTAHSAAGQLGRGLLCPCC